MTRDLIAEYAAYYDNLNGFEWGSCQYQDACAIYRLLCAEEIESSRAATLAAFGIEERPVVTFDDSILEIFKQEQLQAVEEDVDAFDEDWATGKRNLLSQATTVTDILHYCRDSAWDLWGAVSYLAELLFPEWELDPGFEEYDTGLACYLLKSYGYVSDEEPFTNFDT